MKNEQEVWTCDLCGKEQIYTKGNIGGYYFPGWVVLDIISVHGSGVYASGEVSGKHTFCCLDCAIAFLKRVSERKKKSDSRDKEKRKEMDALRKDLVESFSKEDIG